MKALVLKAYNELVYEDVEPPAMGPDDVLIDVRACAICGSDVHGLDGSTGRRIPPLIMGHEASGVIASVGSGVSGWAEGDRVTFDSTLYCGACHFCGQGRINLCDHRRVLGVSCDEYRRNGAFAEVLVVPQHILYHLPEELTFERAALVEPLSIAFHAVRRANVKTGDTVVVVGAGTIGLLAVQALKAAGARAIAVDLDPGKLELARRLGADEILRAGDSDIPEGVMERTDGRGADAALEAVGLPETVADAMACVRKGGAVALIGNLVAEVALPLQTAVTRELSVFGSCASCGEYDECLDLITRGAVNVDALISAVAPLAEGAAWFDRLRAPGSGLLKVVLVPGSGTSCTKRKEHP